MVPGSAHRRRAFDPTTFTKNRQRLLDHEIADQFFAAVVRQAKLRRYVSTDHFTVDGTLLEAWASHKSFKPKDRPTAGAAGRTQHRGATSTARSGRMRRISPRPIPKRAWPARVSDTAAKLCYHGASVDGEPQRVDRRRRAHRGDRLRRAGHRASRCSPGCPARARRRTVAGDKGYDTRDFVAETRELGFTPHVAPEHDESTLRDRWAHHPPSRPPGEPTDPETDRGTLRLDQDDRRRPQAPLHRPSNATGPGSTSTGAVYNLIRITALDATPA